MEQLDMFSLLYEKPEFTNKIRLITLFSGYDSQALALKYLGVDFIHHRTCEWATKSIQALNDLHFRDYTDYSKELSKEQIIDLLTQKGISANYNEAMSKQQIARLSENELRNIYNNIKATHNMVNIQQVHFSDLGTEKGYTHIMTYSFPCQDLSLAGKRAGMEKGSGTRSGMLWEVERILKEREREREEPIQVLLMENVPQVLTDKESWNAWCKSLEEMGYTNYYKVINAKDYGIPQNRKRCFMVSIYGESYYHFPNKIKLKYRLKDLLEKQVDEKYYLDNNRLEQISSWKSQQNPLENVLGKNSESKTITTGVGGWSENEINASVQLVSEELENTTNIRNTLQEIAQNRERENFLMIKNATKQGYLKAFEGDGVDLEQRKGRRGTVQNGLIQTLNTQDNKGVVISYVEKQINKALAKKPDAEFVDIYNGNPLGDVSTTTTTSTGTLGGCGSVAILERNLKAELCNKLIQENKIKEGDVIRHPYTNQRIEGNMKDIQENNISPTLDTRADCLGVATNNQGLRIRKLTPKECWRLMGVLDQDSDKVQEHQSNASMYHLAGDSIVSTCLMALFGELLNIDWKSKVEALVENIKEEL